MALTRDKQILIAVVVLAGLGGGVYFQQKKDAKIGVETISSAELPAIGGSEDIDKFEITNGEKGQVVLEKKDEGKWWVTKPLMALANQSNIKQMIDNLKELKATDLVASNPTEDIKKGYELDSAKAVHVIGYKAGDKKVDDYFGKSGGRGEMMMLEGKPNIYSATGYAVYMYNRDLKGWRDTEIFKFDDGTVNTATIENTHGVISFTKANDKWVGTFNGKPIERFDDDKVKALLMNFKALNAEDFGEGKSPVETGLDKPDGTVTFTLKDGAGKFVVRVGKVATGTSRYAQKEGVDTIYVLATMPSDFATTDIPKFQKPLDGGAAPEAGAAPAMPPGRPGMPGGPGGPGGMRMPPGHPPVPPPH
jgi:hypothetical protein